jgi:RHS repeat-associated protein
MTFDANGNLTTLTEPSGTTTFTWDARNRLVALNGSALAGTFAYDGQARRARRALNGQTAVFQYDGLDIIREQLGASEAGYLRTLTIDESLVRVGTAGTAYYLPDALGSTLALTEGGGTITTTYDYSPFGQSATSGAPTENRFAFTGREADTGELLFYRRRHYHARLHRFLSEDPMSLVPGENRYVYAQNSPAVLLDPLGTWTVPAHKELTRRAMQEAGGFSERDIGQAEAGNAAVDYAYWNAETGEYAASEAHHYMPGTEAQAERIIRERLNDAIAMKRAGRHEEAMQVLGEGMHTLQDKWAHAKQGAGWAEHNPRSKKYTDPDNPLKHPTEYQRAYEDTRQYVEDFKRGRPRKPPRGSR